MTSKPDIKHTNELLTYTICKHWDLDAFSNYKEESISYNTLAQYIVKIHSFYQLMGVQQGDKVALLGRNSYQWAVIYLATVSYGAVIVPILPDFGQNNVQHIIDHSDSVLLFTTKTLLDTIDIESIPQVRAILSIYLDVVDMERTEGKAQDFLKQAMQTEITREEFTLPPIPLKAPALISYTSGTSGFSKGVTLSHLSMFSNIKLVFDYDLKLEAGCKIVSFLPMAHTFGCLVEFLIPMAAGCHITFLSRMPTPAIITQAFREIQPRLILSVPLVIEKIYHRRIQPIVEKPLMRLALSIPGIKQIIYKKIRRKLTAVFGGQFDQIIIGGAPICSGVEAFFSKIKFPYTIGYGMTECGPLISYAHANHHRQRGVGQVVKHMECRINSPQPLTIPGEIQVRGNNVMSGYYKDKESTEAVFTKDGWLKTGDLGIMDASGYIYIKGRSKNMLLTSTGQNIYPEEIETTINNKSYIVESLVRMNQGKLEALVYPNHELVEEGILTHEELDKKLDGLKEKLNKTLPAYAKLGIVTIMTEEFEKTPKRSIKRYMYTLENE